MIRRSIGGVAIAAFASLALAGSALAFSGIINGSFEAGTFSGSQLENIPAGSTKITGWTVEAGSIDWIGSYWLASDGSLSPGTISQTLATTVGNTYTVTFDLSGNPVCGPVVKTMTVGATGGSTETLTYDTSVAGNTPGDMKWQSRTYSFVATVTTTTLTLTSVTDGRCGPALDNIVITETTPTPEPPPVVEPATLADCKDGGWLTLVDASGHAFKNQGDCVSYVATGHRNAAAQTPKAPAHTRQAVSVPGPLADRNPSRGRGHDDGAGATKRGHDPHVMTPSRQEPVGSGS
jgi:choice-of-anchor C domain-containing protein